MDEETRRDLIDRLYNPRTPSPVILWDYGCLESELPPRRTVRERLRALVAWRPRRRRPTA
jgi:hypothetical protein